MVPRTDGEAYVKSNPNTSYIGAQRKVIELPLLECWSILYPGGRTVMKLTDTTDIAMFDQVQSAEGSRSLFKKTTDVNASSNKFFGIVHPGNDNKPQNIGTVAKLVDLKIDYMDTNQDAFRVGLGSDKLEIRIAMADVLDRFETVSLDQADAKLYANVKTFSDTTDVDDRVVEQMISVLGKISNILQEEMGGEGEYRRLQNIGICRAPPLSSAVRQTFIEEAMEYSFWLANVLSEVPDADMTRWLMEELLTTRSTLYRLNVLHFVMQNMTMGRHIL